MNAKKGQFKKLAPAGTAILTVVVVIVANGCAAAQDAGTRPPNAVAGEVNPKVIPGLVKTAAPSGRKGPLAGTADALADYGFAFHALSIDFLTANPTVGLVPGHAENSDYNILGVDLDLGKTTALTNSSLHYETTIFAGNTNINNFLAQTGDTLLGFQGTFNKKVAVISVATFEQKSADGRFDFEIGRTHPNRYYAAPLCQSLDSCFQDILYYNAGFTSPQYSVWGGNLSYKLTPTTYIEAGAFTTNDAARIGYDLGRENDTGVLAIAEIGAKTNFEDEPYPGRYSLTGFYNSSQHADLRAQAVFGAAQPLTRTGTSGIVLEGQKIVWRADGGRGSSSSPTAVALYGSAGTGFDPTTPILASVFVGATLQSPFVGRPADRFGVKFNYERLNSNYAAYLGAANLVSGGPGGDYARDKYVFELNAHLQLPAGLAFEPVLQYAINPNSFYNPFTARRARDGLFAIGTLVVPLGILAGLTPG